MAQTVADRKALVALALVGITGTVVSAATVLNVDATDVVSRLRKCERRFGVCLLDSVRGIELTPAGERLLPYATRYLEGEVRLLAAVRGLGRERSQELVVGATPSSEFAPERTRVVSGFERLWPQATLKIVEADSATLIRWVHAGEIDAALALLPPARPADSAGRGVRFALLQHSRAMLVARAQDGAVLPEHMSLPDLAGRRVCVFPRSNDPEAWDRWFRRLADTGVDLFESPEWNAPALVSRVIRRGDVAVVSDWELDAMDQATRSALTTRSFDHLFSCDDLYLIAREGPADSLVSRLLDVADGADAPARSQAVDASAPDGDHLTALTRDVLVGAAAELWQDGLKPESLRALLTVADRQSFSHAARDLFTSQPWVSTQVKAIEQSLGATLLTRSTRHVELTAEGGLLVPLIDEIVTAADAAVAALAAGSRAGAEQLRIGAPIYTANLAARAALIEGLLDLRPDLDLRISHGLTNELLPALKAGAIDAAFVTQPVDTSGLRTLTVVRHNKMLAAPADHALARLDVVRRDDLAGHELASLHREMTPAYYDAIYRPLAEAGVKIVTPGHLVSGLRGAAVNLGLCYLARADEVPAPGWVLRPLDPPITSELIFAMRDDAIDRDAVRFLWTIARSVFGSKNPPQPSAGA